MEGNPDSRDRHMTRWLAEEAAEALRGAEQGRQPTSISATQHNYSGPVSQVDLTNASNVSVSVGEQGARGCLSQERFCQKVGHVKEYFVDIHALQTAKQLLETHGHVSICGAPGDGNKRTVADFSSTEIPDLGYPDGMTVDTEGKLWVACFGAGKVVRLDPETGKVIRTVKFPCEKITSCCFGGDDFTDLYVTSSKYLMTAAELATPLAGSVFKVTGFVSTISVFVGFTEVVNGHDLYYFGLSSGELALI